MPAEESVDMESPIGGEPEELETFDGDGAALTSGLSPETGKGEDDPVNAEAYVDRMVRLLRGDGVRFPDNKVVRFSRLERMSGELLHAEGQWQANGGDLQSVAVVFGPQYGPVTARMVEECLRIAYRRGYDDLVFAGFSFDGAAQAAIQADPNPRVRIHMTQIRPDVNMEDLLKDTPNSQLFTVSGTPRTNLNDLGDGEFSITMEGVDIYDPIGNTVRSARADKVAAWFLDSDYDGGTFCITQAFFPDKNAWEKLSKALTGVVDPERFEALSGTVSLPFRRGKHDRAAVKVIDPRGNGVMRCITFLGRPTMPRGQSQEPLPIQPVENPIICSPYRRANALLGLRARYRRCNEADGQASGAVLVQGGDGGQRPAASGTGGRPERLNPGQQPPRGREALAGYPLRGRDQRDERPSAALVAQGQEAKAVLLPDRSG